MACSLRVSTKKTIVGDDGPETWHALLRKFQETSADSFVCYVGAIDRATPAQVWKAFDLSVKPLRKTRGPKVKSQKAKNRYLFTEINGVLDSTQY